MSSNVTDELDPPFISDQLDTFIDDLGSSFLTVVALAAILLSILVASFGARPANSKYSAFLAGTLLGLFASAFILVNLEDSSDDSDGGIEFAEETWVGIFFGSGLFVGVLCYCLVSVGKLVVAVASAVLVVMFILQSGIVLPQIVLIVVLLILSLVSAYVTYKFIEYAFAIFSSFFAGFLMVFGVGVFTDGAAYISLNEIMTNPDDTDIDLAECGSSCTVPLGLGVITVLISLIYNWVNVKKLLRRKEKILEKKEENEQFLTEIKSQRMIFEERLKDLQTQNGEIVQHMDSVAAENERLRQEVVAKEEEVLQTQAQATQLVEKDEIDAQTKEFYDLQTTSVELKAEILKFGDRFLQNVKLEKNLKVNINEKEFERLQQDNYYQYLMKEEIQLIEDLKTKNEEFKKFKLLIKDSRTSQKDLLKNVKKSYTKVEKDSKQIKKLLKSNSTLDVFNDVKLKIEDLKLEIKTLEMLVSRYVESDTIFTQLVEDLTNTVEHFRDNEAELAQIFAKSAVFAQEAEVEVEVEDVIVNPIVVDVNESEAVARERTADENNMGEKVHYTVDELNDELAKYLKHKARRLRARFGFGRSS